MPGAELRPRSVSEIVDAALRLLHGHYAAWVMLLALLSLPSILFSQIMFDSMHLVPGGRIAWGTTAVVFAASLVVNAIAEAAAVTAMSGVYFGEPLDLARALRRTASRLGPLLVATVIRWVLMIGGGLLLLIPGIFAAIRTACLDCSVMLEDASDDGVSAFRRTWALTYFREGHILLTMLLMFAIYAAGYAVVVLLVRAAALAVPVLHGARLRSLAEAAFLLLIVPIIPAVRTVLYYDLRIRAEGLDVELLVRALDAAPPAR